MPATVRSRPALAPALSPLCLTREEVAELTGRTQRSAQRRVLQYMGIDHKQRPDGSLVVFRSGLDAAAGIGHATKRTEPNWG
jgi:hypothetical protein